MRFVQLFYLAEAGNMPEYLCAEVQNDLSQSLLYLNDSLLEPLYGQYP